MLVWGILDNEHDLDKWKEGSARHGAGVLTRSQAFEVFRGLKSDLVDTRNQSKILALLLGRQRPASDTAICIGQSRSHFFGFFVN